MGKKKTYFKALLIKPPSNPIDVREIVDIACAEFKKMMGIRGNLQVVDFMIRPYGVWVVIEVPKDVGILLRLK